MFVEKKRGCPRFFCRQYYLKNDVIKPCGLLQK